MLFLSELSLLLKSDAGSVKFNIEFINEHLNNFLLSTPP